ncbi:hypothetical protein KAH55_03330 [bacterium]|nr:hypothetical protein [bacterium]
MKRILFGILIFWIIAATLSAQSVFVDYEHPVYDFIRQMEARSLFEKFDGGTQPYLRTEIAVVLAQVDSVALARPELFSRTEQQQLEQYKGEFCDELAGSGVMIAERWRERHAISWQERNSRLYLDFYMKQQFEVYAGDSYENDEYPNSTTLGAILRGDLGENLSFLVDVQNMRRSVGDSLTETFDPSQGQPVVTTGDQAYSDKAAAYLNWNTPWFTLKFGRDRIKWGPGYHGGMVLSRTNPLFDHLLLQTRYKSWNFQYLHGWLNSNFSQKYIAAHRVEWHPLDWLYLGGNETVVYGNREVEVQYLNPIMPYHVAEHHLGDKDNNMIGFDFSIFPLPNTKLYFETIIDDFTSSENIWTYYGNKFGFLAGAYWVNPLGLANTDVRLEYARVEPYVYTHYDSVNVYINYDQYMGYWTGPNSEDIFVEFNYRPYRDVRVQLGWEQIRKGAGDMYQSHRDTKDLRKHWLAGVVEKKHVYSLDIRDQIRKDIFLGFQAWGIKTWNYHRTAGDNRFDKQFAFVLDINY